MSVYRKHARGELAIGESTIGDETTPTRRSRRNSFVTAALFFVFNSLIDGRPEEATAAPCGEWNLAADFRTFPNEANPNPDSCGNVDVWRFLESDSNAFPAHLPSSYSLLPEFVSDAFFIPGLEEWQGTVVSSGPKGKLPAVGVNNTGITQFAISIVWPPEVVRVHPLANQFAIVGWRSPIAGEVSVRGGVEDLDTSCGNGVAWAIDYSRGLSNTTLASGSISNGGAESFQDGVGGAALAVVRVSPGDFL